MKNKQYIKNTVLLFTAMAITKIVGAIFKIPLANILGGTGMGYFSTAYGLYSPVFAVTAAGVPTVLMRMTAQNIASGRGQNALRIKKTAILIFSVIGATGCIIIRILAKTFADKIACSPESIFALRMIAPAVLFCSTGAVIRGYYEGQSNVIPSAAANITEAVSRAVTGLALSYGTIAYAKYCYDNSTPFFGRYYNNYEELYAAALPYAAAAAILAVTISELCGLVILLVHDRRHGRKQIITDPTPLDKHRSIAAQLIKEIIPISASALVMNLFSFTDLFTVTRTLETSIQTSLDYYERAFSSVIESGITIDGLANFMYGSYTGIAMSLFMLIPSFAGMTEKTAIPHIAAAWEKKDDTKLNEATTLLIRSCSIIGFPACMGAAVLAEPIMSLLYSGRPEEISVCINSFVVLCLGGMFMIITSAMTGIFQAVGKAHIPLLIMSGAVIIKAILNPLLISVPEINITGTAISTISSYIFASAAGCMILKKYISNYKVVIPILPAFMSAVLCTVAAKTVYANIENVTEPLISLGLSVVSGGIVYVLSLILTGVFRTSPIRNKQNKKIFTKGVAK